MREKKIGQILIEMGVLTPKEAARIAAGLDRRDDPIKFGQLAKKMGFATEEEILAALAVQMEVVPLELQKNIRKVLHTLSDAPPPKSPIPIRLSKVRKRLGADKSEKK